MHLGDSAAHLEHVLEEYVLNNGYHFDAMEGRLLADEVVRLRAEVISCKGKAEYLERKLAKKPAPVAPKPAEKKDAGASSKD